MKNLFVIFILIALSSCNVKQVYTSASYGALKSYTEKPIYDGKKASSVYISGSYNQINHPQYLTNTISTNTEAESDKASIMNFSIYKTTTEKSFNYYYGLGGSYGNYQFNSDITNLDNTINYVKQNEKLAYYNVNLKAGFNFTKTWEKFEYSIGGVELIYVNEFGSYLDKISSLPNIPNVVVVDEKSIFAANFNTDITFRVDKEKNIGAGVFVGQVLFLDKVKTHDKDGFFVGFMLKYNYKNFSISMINEHSARKITSTKFGITYSIFNSL